MVKSIYAALEFDAQFYELVRHGEKTSAIRSKTTFNVGDTVELLCDGELLVNGVCTAIDTICMTASDECRLAGIVLDDKGRYELAVRDGFNDFDELYAYVVSRYGVPFFGVYVRWQVADL